MVGMVLIVLFGVFCCSTAVIMIKASGEHSLLLAAYRLLLAVVILLPVFLRDLRKHRACLPVGYWRSALIPGLLLATHFMSWIIGCRMTTAANSSLIVNLVPVAMPFFMFVWVRERPTRNELWGTVLAIAGVLWMSLADVDAGLDYVIGDVLCFASMLTLAGYLAFARRQRHVPTSWLYVVPVYTVAGLTCLAIGCFFANPIKPYAIRELYIFLGLAVVPTIGGHTLLNWGMRRLRGQVVSLINMTQFMFSGVLAFWLLKEVPGGAFYGAGALSVVAVWLAVRREDEGCEPEASPGRTCLKPDID